jgi:hypothetical protein
MTNTPKTQHNINDMVEEIFLLLAGDKDFSRLIGAVDNKQAVGGALFVDDFLAAEMIRDKAKTVGNLLAGEKLATISKALGVVLRRYGMSRKQRREQGIVEK